MIVRFLRKLVFMFQVVLVLGCMYGCASVPKESVALSASIGNGISESRRSHINQLNYYFLLKREVLDQKIEQEYMPSLVAKIQASLKNSGKPETLAPNQIADVIRTVIHERDQKQAELEKTRLLLFEKLDAHYSMLAQSNLSLTTLLQSMIDVNEATTAAAGSVKTMSGNVIDLGAVDQKISEYLKQAGALAEKGTSLYEEIKTITEKKGE